MQDQREQFSQKNYGFKGFYQIRGYPRICLNPIESKKEIARNRKLKEKRKKKNQREVRTTHKCETEKNARR